jgi:plasmid stabilization system protein ParE
MHDAFSSGWSAEPKRSQNSRFSGRAVPEVDRTDIREVVEPPYRIIYRVLPDRIEVLTVMHGAQILREIPGLGAP